MDLAPRLRVISRTGVGYDTVDVVAATARGIAVCFAPDAPTVSTAEHTIALMLAVTKDISGWAQPLVRSRAGCAARHRARRPDARSVRLRSHRPARRRWLRGRSACTRSPTTRSSTPDGAGRHARRRRRAVAPVRRGHPPRAGDAVDSSTSSMRPRWRRCGPDRSSSTAPAAASSTTTPCSTRSSAVTSPAPGSTSPSPSRSLPTTRCVATRGSSSPRTSPRTPRSDVCGSTSTPSTTPSPCSPASADASCPSSAMPGEEHAVTTLRERWAAGTTTLGAWLAIPSIDRRRDDRTHRLRLRVRRPAARRAGLRRLRRPVPGGPARRLDADRPGAVERTRRRRQGPRRRCRSRHRADGQHRRSRRPLPSVPRGTRRSAPEASDRRWPVPRSSNYAATANDVVAVIPMIETVEALGHLDDILSVPGVDAIYVGPADLSLSLGLPPGNNDDADSFREALDDDRRRLPPPRHRAPGSTPPARSPPAVSSRASPW